jgi:hypothetical protein
MQDLGGQVHLTASDLVGHVNCRYLTQLDLAVVRGEIQKPSIWDPSLDLLVERGAIHEKGYIDYLAAGGRAITTIDGVGVDTAAVDATLAAMRTGVPIIIQGALQSGRWSGRADVLHRVEKSSGLGSR